MTTRAVALTGAMEEAGYQSGDSMIVDLDGDRIETWLLVPSHEVITVNGRLNTHAQIFDSLDGGHDFVQDPADILGGCKVCWEAINASEASDGS